MTEEFDKTTRRPSSPLGGARESVHSAAGAEILVVNWQNATAPEVRSSMNTIEELLKARAKKILMLFDVGGMRWDAKLPFEGVTWMKSIAPFTGRVAIIGVAGLQQSVLSGLRALTKMPLPVFADRSAATAWLTRPRGAG